MGKLQELRDLVAEWFNSAETADKGTIDKLSQLNKLSEEVAQEHNKLEEEQKALMNDYKELIKHTSFSDTKIQPLQQVEPVLSLEDALEEFCRKNK